MFWQYNTMSTTQIETVLEKEDVSLAEVLDQENVIQECKTQTKKLIDFLTKPEILSELISLITTEPPEESDESNRFKLPHVASEILSCEVHQISSAISQDEALLEKLFAFMENEAPLNPLLASFFSKAVGIILARKAEQNWYDHQFICVKVIDFLKKKDFVNLALRHIATSAITDLVLRLITCIENGDIRTGILEWLNERELVQSIIKLIDKKHDRDTHDNAARLVIEILRVSRDGQYAQASDRFDDPLLNTIESGETVELLLKIIFEMDNNSSVISNGISILLALLETRTAVNCYNQNQDFGAEFGSQSNEISTEDAAKQEMTLNAILDAILPFLPEFTNLLTNPPALAPMNTTAGLLDPPLGQTRLNVAKLMCALLGTNNKAINAKLRELGTMNILLDLFFKYSLNNFLHAQVKECVRLVFAWNNSPMAQNEAQKSPTTVRVKTPPTVEMIDPQSEDEKEPETSEEDKKSEASAAEIQEEKKSDEENQVEDGEKDEEIYDNPLLIDLFTNCRLIERVLEAWEENESEEHRPGFHRKGYMGHLTNIANIMHQNMTNKSPSQLLVTQLLSQYPPEMREKWDKFVDIKLNEINERNKIVPPSAYANKHSSSDDDDADFKDVLISNESSSAQLFSDYQMQQMSENFVDTFGFSDAAFNDDADNEDPDEMRRLTNVLSDEDPTSTASEAIKRAQGIFEEICDQRFTSFPGTFEGDSNQDEDEDPWADKTKEISFATKSPEITENSTQASTPSANATNEKNSSSEDSSEDDEKPPKSMEVDEDEELNHRNNEVIESGSGSAEVAMDTGNPWDSKPLAASTTAPFDNPFDSPKVDEGWANFKGNNSNQDSEMSPFKADFEAAFEPKDQEDATGKNQGENSSPVTSPVKENVPSATISGMQ